jgi:cytochrome c556
MSDLSDGLDEDSAAVDLSDTGVERPGQPDEKVPPARKELVKKIRKEILADKKHHEPAFKRMLRDMKVAMNGRTDDWSEKNYTANITGRHINQAVASLYAKNPKAVARRRETLDFAVWDENPSSLQLAFQTVQMAQMAAQQPPMIDEMGMPVEPQMPPGFEQAMAVMEDFQQGTQRRQIMKKVGRTLEVLFANTMHDQEPLDFKTALKQLVRRAKTTGVGYIELGFKREMGSDPIVAQQLVDAEARLAHMQEMMKDVAEGSITEEDAEYEELILQVKNLQSEPEIITKEGLVFDYPASNRVVPDRMTKSLVGFVGARHITVELLFTKQQVQEMFGVDLKGRYTAYTVDGKPGEEDPQGEMRFTEEGEGSERQKAATDLVCVWKHYDKVSGNVHYMADGYDDFLREPGPPDVRVTGFWPVYALTFNEVESDKELFPPSDVGLILDMQSEYNRSRQGMREHRQAARPRWVFPNGVLDEQDRAQLGNSAPFTAMGLNIPSESKIADILQPVPIAGVDPNLYETGQIFQDIQLVVGTQEAMLGGLAKATATESSIAASASAGSVASGVDDLDGFLTRVTRAASQILMLEMSEEQVRKIAGPGALWPQQTLQEISDELFLEVEAGSTGKPNQAAEVQNWERMLPFLIQMPSIDPTWLARESIRRLDDRLDLTEAIAAAIPSIVAQNANAQPSPADPGNDPNAQGGEGANNAPAGDGGAPGTDAAFGSNQV